MKYWQTPASPCCVQQLHLPCTAADTAAERDIETSADKAKSWRPVREALTDTELQGQTAAESEQSETEVLQKQIAFEVEQHETVVRLRETVEAWTQLAETAGHSQNQFLDNCK